MSEVNEKGLRSDDYDPHSLLCCKAMELSDEDDDSDIPIEDWFDMSDYERDSEYSEHKELGNIDNESSDDMSEFENENEYIGHEKEREENRNELSRWSDDSKHEAIGE